jgi:Sec63 Brl domain
VCFRSKSLKYKLDGAPSKIRVQNPQQKAFVLLQASVGQIHLEDYTLRQEMASMVDYSSRILSAVEEYSVKGSGHGHVVMQSLMLRRSLATSLWCGQNGVLSQLTGMGHTTTANLKFHGIVSFQDVLASSSEAIEKAAQRTPPFGSNLRDIVSKILRSTLKLTAKLEYLAETSKPVSLICELYPRFDDSSSTPLNPSVSSPVTYHLLAFTDLPGGCLLFKTDISGQSSFRVNIPQNFGRITVVLFASLVGLDGKLRRLRPVNDRNRQK